jgi:hypothetical protein
MASNVFNSAFVLHYRKFICEQRRSKSALSSPPAPLKPGPCFTEYCSGVRTVCNMLQRNARPQGTGIYTPAGATASSETPSLWTPLPQISPQHGSVNRRLVLACARIQPTLFQGRAQIQYVRGITEGIRTASTDELVNILMAPILSGCSCGRLIPLPPDSPLVRSAIQPTRELTQNHGHHWRKRRAG